MRELVAKSDWSGVLMRAKRFSKSARQVMLWLNLEYEYEPNKKKHII